MIPLINIKNLKYLSGSREILINTELMPQGMLSIQGPSGTGKTTLLRILARLNEPISGEVFLKERSWQAIDPIAWRRKVHYFAQKPVVFDGTVKENILKPFELSAVKEEALPNMSLVDQLMERMLLPKTFLERDARQLSGGETARVALIRALLIQPQVIMLDEPLASLDSKTAEAVSLTLADWCLSKEDRGIIMVSHVGVFDKLSRAVTLDLSEKILGKEAESGE